MKRLKTILTGLFIISLYFLTKGSVYAASTCSQCITGSFNAGGSSNGCPNLKIAKPDSGESYIRFEDGGGYYDKAEVQRWVGKFPTDKPIYFMPMNEPNLEGWTDQQVLERIIDWSNLIPSNVTIVIPPYAHGEGVVIQDALARQTALLQSIRNARNNGDIPLNVNFELGANVYAGLNDPVAGAEQVIMAHTQLISEFNDFLSGLMISELGIVAHPWVVNGCLSVDQWMAGTAALMESMYDTTNGIGAALPPGTVSFSGLLKGDQTPVNYDCSTGTASYNGISIDQNLVQQALNGELASGLDPNKCTIPQEDLKQYLTCEDPKIGSGVPACETCDGTAEFPIEDKRTIWNTVTDYITDALGNIIEHVSTSFAKNIFPQKYRVQVQVAENKGPVTPLNQQNCEITGFNPNKEESSIAYMAGCYFDDGLNLKQVDTDSTGNFGIPNTFVALPPGNIPTQQDIQNCMDTKTRQQVKINNAEGPIDVAQERIWCALQFISPIANSIWSIPNQNQVSFTPPPGLTMADYISPALAKQREEYVAFNTKELNSKNYSYEQDFDIAMNAVQERRLKNSVDYANSQLVDNPYNIQLTADLLNITADIPACPNPKKLSQKDVCSVADYYKNRTTYVTTKDPLPDKECSGNIDCVPSDPTTFNHPTLVTYDYYGGRDVSPGGGYESVTGSDILIKNYSGSVSQNNSKIKLVATTDTLSSIADTNAGFIPLAESLALAMLPPKEKVAKNKQPTFQDIYNVENLDQKSSSRIDFKLAKIGGKGEFVNTQPELYMPSDKGRACAQTITTSLGSAPGELDKGLEGKIKGCFKDETSVPDTPSYCGVSNKTITNFSGNYTVTKGGDREGGGSSVEANIADIVDPTSPLKLKLAVRYVDGAVLITTNSIAGFNPGQKGKTGCGGGENRACGGGGVNVTIYRLPLSFHQSGVEPKYIEEQVWLDNAYRITEGGGNTVIDLNVKPGIYRIAPGGNACFYNVIVAPGTETSFILENTDLSESVIPSSTVRNSYCAKVTMNSSMPKGYSCSWDFSQYCKLNSPYNLDVNNHCRNGLSGPGSEAYKEIFGISPGQLGGNKDNCAEAFPGVLIETDCGTTDNRDIGQGVINQSTTQDNEVNVTIDPPYEAKSPLPATGRAMYYNQGIMESVIQKRIGWGQLDSNVLSKGYKGYIALLRKGDIGREVWLDVPGIGVEGPYLVADVAAKHDIPLLLQRDWVVDVDYNTAKRWKEAGVSMLGIGPLDGVRVLDNKP